MSPGESAVRSPAGTPITRSLAILAVTAALSASAFFQLFTTFRFWDDEGYVLTSLRNFAAGGRLYSVVISQYGPAYNLFYAFLNRLGAPLDASGARWMTLGVWVLSSLLGAGLVLRLGASRLWACAAAPALFVHLHKLTDEPLHPVGMIVLLLAAGAAGAVTGLIRGRPRRALAWAAAAGMALALVKINIGLFFLAGLGIFILWSTRGPLASRGARIALGVLASLAGIALMRALVHEHWVAVYLAVYMAASITTLSVVALVCVPSWQATESVFPAGAAAAVTAAVILGCALACGIGPAQLWFGIIRGPLRQPTAFSFGFRWSHATLPVLAANGAACALYLLVRGRPAWADRIVAASRITLGAGYLISFYHGFAVSPEAYLLSFGPSFIWAFAAPLAWRPERQSARHQARLLLAVLALFQILHAFPVAGTQVPAGTLLLALLLMAGLAETGIWLELAWPSVSARRLATLGGIAAVVLAGWGFIRATGTAQSAYARQPPESFSGARLRLSPWQTSTLSTLIANARLSGDVLYSLPGMFSLNLWSKLPTPNDSNVTQWWSFLSEEQQLGVAARLRAAERPVIIVQENLYRNTGFMARTYRDGPLARCIEQEFTRLFSIDGYEFRIRLGAGSLPIGIARWNPGPGPGGFAFYQPAAQSGAAARLELIGYEGDAPAPFALEAGGFEIQRSGSLAASGLERWSVALKRLPGANREKFDAVRLTGADGRIVAAARFERPEPQLNPN